MLELQTQLFTIINSLQKLTGPQNERRKILSLAHTLENTRYIRAREVYTSEADLSIR